MAASAESFSTTQSVQADGKKPSAPASALLAACLGGAIALAAAASLSFDALCDLAHHAGLHRLAPLLPIAVDAFAASALFVSYRLPPGHTAHRAASRTARLALVLTVACNGLDHLLDLAGHLLTEHVRELLLVAVASLPPLIVERLLHLQTVLVGEGRTAATGILTGQRPPAISGLTADVTDQPSGPPKSVPTAEALSDEGAIGHQNHDGSAAAMTDHSLVQRPGHIGQTDHALGDVLRRPSGRPGEERWLSVAAPVYHDLAARTGRRPTESAFHAALTDALISGNASGAEEEVGSEAVATVSLSTAKRIRALVEDHGMAGWP